MIWLAISLGIPAYLLVGYLTGKKIVNEYNDNTLTEEMGLLGKIKRILLFPKAFSNWENRKETCEFPVIIREMLGSYTTHNNERAYISLYMIFWPLLRPISFIVGILKGFLLLTYNGFWKTEELYKNFPSLYAKFKLRPTLKALFWATWGQSIAGAPVWCYLLGWKFAALNIGFSWLVNKFGQKALIGWRKKESSENFSGVIEMFRKAQTDELNPEIAKLMNLLQEISGVIKAIEEKIYQAEKSTETLKYQGSHLAEGYALASERLKKSLQEHRNRKENVAKALDEIKKTSSELESGLRLVELNQFIEKVGTSTAKDSAKLLQSIGTSMNTTRRLIAAAYGVEVPALIADENITEKQWVGRLETGIKEEMKMAERAIDPISPRVRN